MIEQISGKLISKNGQDLVVLVGGIGFGICATYSAANNTTIGQDITLQTYFAVKEDSMTLFGFSTIEEKEMFQKLISISGIGPKMAQSILSAATSSELASAIISGNIQVLSKIKGVGKKTAERIVLELKEQIQQEVQLHSMQAAAETPKGQLSAQAQDAVYGLRALGIKEAEATKIVQSVAKDGMTAEEIITISIKGLAK